MKKIKRFLTIGLAIMLTFCISVSFVACKEEEYVAGPIPDGDYDCVWDESDGNVKTFIYNEKTHGELSWEIEGQVAIYRVSNSVSEQAKVVEKDGKIYFECYRWTTILDLMFFWVINPIKGSEDVYLVEYNAEEKTITVELYKEGE